MTDDLKPGWAYLRFARHNFKDDLGTRTDPEEVARYLIKISKSGPRLWCGINILRGLGLIHDDHETLQ